MHDRFSMNIFQRDVQKVDANEIHRAPLIKTGFMLREDSRDRGESGYDRLFLMYSCYSE